MSVVCTILLYSVVAEMDRVLKKKNQNKQKIENLLSYWNLFVRVVVVWGLKSFEQDGRLQSGWQQDSPLQGPLYQHLTVQEMMTISASAGTIISIISNCPTYAEICQFCSTNCLRSP